MSIGLNDPENIVKAAFILKVLFFRFLRFTEVCYPEDLDLKPRGSVRSEVSAQIRDSEKPDTDSETHWLLI